MIQSFVPMNSILGQKMPVMKGTTSCPSIAVVSPGHDTRKARVKSSNTTSAKGDGNENKAARSKNDEPSRRKNISVPNKQFDRD
jgi:hypothetical protein